MKKIGKIIQIISLALVLLPFGCTKKTDEMNVDVNNALEETNEASFETVEQINNEETLTIENEISEEENKKYPEPLELSGNPEDVVETDDYEYIIGEKCVIFVDKGCKIPGDLVVVIEDVMTALENETGMTFNNDGFYNNEDSKDWIISYFGKDYWNGFSGGKEKINIILCNDNEHEGLVSCATDRTAVFINPDFKVHKYGIGPVAHELTHVLMDCNHDYYENKISEGFATYWQVNLIKALPQYAIPTVDADEKYFGLYKENLNAQTAESLFLKDYSRMDGNQPYEYGFGLVTYLYETYSLDEVNGFLNCLDERLLNYKRQQADEKWTDEEFYENMMFMGSLEFEAEVVKEYFGDDFFTKFGKWYSDNKNRFIE